MSLREILSAFSWKIGPYLDSEVGDRRSATQKLIEGLTGAVARRKLKGLIRLKNEFRKLVRFEDSEQTRRLDREMVALNEFLATIDVGIAAPDVVKLPNHWQIAGETYRVATLEMYRVFNRGFGHGGRLYTPLQNLPKSHRPDLLLNGEPTVELDIRQLHPALLYDERGLVPPEDAYRVKGFYREEGKLALNVAINCAGGQRGTITALMNTATNSRRLM